MICMKQTIDCMHPPLSYFSFGEVFIFSTLGTYPEDNSCRRRRQDNALKPVNNS